VIELGTLALHGSVSILNARAKIKQLAVAIGLGPVVATRLATATSETARRLVANGEQPTIRVGLVRQAAATSLELAFEGWRTDPDDRALVPFFDTVGRAGADGTRVTRARIALRPDSPALTEAFIEEQRRQLVRRSRAELMRDIAEQNRELERHRHRLEELVEERTSQLRDAQVAAEQANRAKSQFLSNMSHELRTPLNGVLGYTQVLRRDPNLSPDQRESLVAIESCGRHLLTLINDVLDLAKIEAGRMELDYAPCDVRRLIRSVFDIVRPRAEASGLEIGAEVAEQLPRGISTDPTKLKQVLVNILGNAVKFTQSGSVRLVASVDDDRLRLDVIDTGIGMTTEEAAAIFDPFKQAEGGKTGGGTGLGLSISKKIVEQMGGTVAVQSERGRGSRFTVDLPLVEAALEGDAGESLAGDRDVVLAPGQDVTLLVADDNDANRDILARLLGGAGFNTIQARDGQEALDRLREHRIPLVLMDVRMPGMDGSQATRVIREDPDLRATKVIAVTASVFPDFWDQMGDVGFDGFVAKPIRARDIFDVVEKHLGLTYVDAGTAEGPVVGVSTTNLDVGAIDPDLARTIAEQLGPAIDMGDIDSVGRLADALAGDEAALAAEIGRLVRGFDLAALEALTVQLTRRGTGQ